MRNVNLSIQSEDLPTIRVQLSTFMVTRPLYRIPSIVQVEDHGMITDSIEINKEDVEAIALDDFKEIIEYLNIHCVKQTMRAKDLTQGTLSFMFQSKEGRDSIKEMLKNAASLNKDRFKGKRRQEFFDILELEMREK